MSLYVAVHAASKPCQCCALVGPALHQPAAWPGNDVAVAAAATATAAAAAAVGTVPFPKASYAMDSSRCF